MTCNTWWSADDEKLRCEESDFGLKGHQPFWHLSVLRLAFSALSREG